MIGSVEWAYIINWLISSEATQETIEDYGYTYLGRGMSRVAYLGPDNVVYKLNIHPFGSYGNTIEWEVWQSWQDKELPDWFYLPQMQLWPHDVLAAEYMGDDDEDYYLDSERHLQLGRLGFMDLHYANIREMNDGRVALIDLGHCSPSD